jgi:hypothetical protein
VIGDDKGVDNTSEGCIEAIKSEFRREILQSRGAQLSSIIARAKAAKLSAK